MKRTWYFIDIDGCIMDSLFGNDKFYTNDQEKIDNLINCYKRARYIELYPQFIIWFEKLHKDPYTTMIIFITGRQKNCLGWLTSYQLNPLLYQDNGIFKTHYFPDYYNHTWDKYIQFKIRDIYKTLMKHKAEKHKDIIKIYDDCDFSDKLEALEIILDMNIEFNLITKPEDWEKL